MRKITFLISVLCLLVLPTIMAPSTEPTETTSTLESITLKTDGNSISWETEGYSPKGFKVTWSKNENPTYPTREGDKYHYHASPDKNTDTLTCFNGEGTYYVRVCEYLGGKCGKYSNQIEIYLKENNQEIEKEINKIPEENNPTKEPTNCNGCLSDDTCYPLGHRINGTFCSNDFNLTTQFVENSPCENNFECKSNICVSGECISAGFIRKVINWFKAFF